MSSVGRDPLPSGGRVLGITFRHGLRRKFANNPFMNEIPHQIAWENDHVCREKAAASDVVCRHIFDLNGLVRGRLPTHFQFAFQLGGIDQPYFERRTIFVCDRRIADVGFGFLRTASPGK